jgi:hypothetical protein
MLPDFPFICFVVFRWFPKPLFSEWHILLEEETAERMTGAEGSTSYELLILFGAILYIE